MNRCVSCGEVIPEGGMYCEKCWRDSGRKFLEITEEALDKQMPKKPIQNKRNKYGICPSCGSALMHTLYCGNCGQKIAWPFDED